MFASIRNVNPMRREFGDLQNLSHDLQEILQSPNCFAWDLDNTRDQYVCFSPVKYSSDTSTLLQKLSGLWKMSEVVWMSSWQTKKKSNLWGAIFMGHISNGLQLVDSEFSFLIRWLWFSKVHISYVCELWTLADTPVEWALL